MDITTALQLVLKKAMAHGGLICGLYEVAKAIEKHAVQLCVLAEDCDQTLIKALCADHNVHLISVESAKTLGEWAGLCKIDSEGNARKVIGASCVVVKDYGEESASVHIVQERVMQYMEALQMVLRLEQMMCCDCRLSLLFYVHFKLWNTIFI